ncbi:serine/threonine-protein kinase [Frankia sp. Cr1]|uniref:serine/threonine protein kinase n=1 Tax=Frankia sp. Cr1 TaxID=3073931 RepID=UPI002AD273F2|nr:serine/threonine-protein kinase [Frankia sp. Cr1]
MIRIGTEIGGRFIVDGILGDGGSGETFSARDTKLGRRVAVKIQTWRSFESTTRYSESASCIGDEFQLGRQSLSGLRGIPEFYDSGTHAGRRYVIMELVDGVTLENVMRKSRPVGSETVAAVIGQLCEILEPVHRQRIVHCDIKLENVMVEPGGMVWLLDFGIAAREDEIGYVAGTPGYAPPEQYDGRSLTTQADIYALGALLFTMSVMLPPYAESGGRPGRRVEPFSFGRLENMHPRLRSVGLSMISWDPANRPATVREVLDALRPLLPGPGSPRNPKAPRPDPTRWYRDPAPTS